MPTGIGSGIAGDVFQNFLGDGSGGGVPVCPSRYSWLGDGTGAGGPWGSISTGPYYLGATSSSASIWYKPIDIRGATNLGAGLYSTDTGGASFSDGTNIFTSPSGVLTASLGSMIFPAHPELITNGSFSNVPVGTELIANPTFSDAASITPWNITGAPNATITWNARFMRLTYIVANGEALFDVLGQTLNAMYSVKMRVRGVTAAGADQGSAFDKIGDNTVITSANIISNPTLTSEYQDYEFRVWSTDIYFNLYLATAAIGDVVDFDSISVKPLTMLVDNGNFGNGTTDWSNDGSSTISVGTHAGRDDVADINITGTGTGDRITQSFSWTEGKSYKVNVEVYLVSGSFRVDTSDGFVPGNFVETTTTGSWQTLTGYITATGTGPSDIFIRSSLAVSQFYVDSISLEELGEDWLEIDQDPDSVSFGENGLTIVQSSDGGAANRAYQTSVTEANKSYKVTYTIHSAQYTSTNRVQYYNGAGYIDLPEQGVGTHTFYYIRKGTNDNWFFNLYTSVAAPTDEVTISSVSVEEVLSENEWHHLALSIDRDSEWKWYVDGVLTNTMDNSTDQAPVIAGISTLGLTNLSTAIASFYGNMTEPSLWNIPLSASEVKDIYDNMYGGQRCLGSLPFTSDLITNGNFTQIGPELITNGDFSATGSELVVNGDFLSATSWNVNSNWNINTVSGVAEADGTSNADINQNVWLPVIGKSYKVTFEVVSLTQGRVLFKMGGVNGEGHTTIGIKTEYIVATSTDRIRIDSEDSFIGSVKDVSVKELGEDWTSYELGTSNVTFGENVAEINIDALNSNVGIYQENIFSVGKSYKIVLSMKATASFDAEILEANNASTESTIGTASLTTSYQDFTYYFTATGTFDLFIHRLFSASGASQTIYVQSVVVQEVGQDWTVVNTDATHYVEFPGVGARFVADTLSPQLWLRQDGIITPGKSYTVTCNVAYASGSGAVKAYVGGDESLSLTEGFNTVTLTATTGFNFAITRNASNVDCVITNVTVTQVGGGNLERWWRMNGLEPLLITLPNVAPNGTVNDCVPTNTPIIQLDTP